MVIYVPILKGKPGEFMAVRNATPEVMSNVRVIMEVVPTRGTDFDLNTFVNGVSVGWPTDSVLTYDTGFLEEGVAITGTVDGPVVWTAKALHDRSVPARPVMRLDDGPDFLADIAAAVAIHRNGVCLRIGSVDAPPDANEAEARIEETFGASGATPADTHLLIDLQSVSSNRELTLLLPVAREMLDWAAARGDWASVTVASGAFPISTSTLPTNTNTPIRRFDADLYRELVTTGPAIQPDFGDFGICHPSIPIPVPRPPNPNLRYTHEREWQVFKQARALPGNESFFTVCAEVVASPFWPVTGPDYSWGDAQVHRCSQNRGGAGRALEWRAYGTSRHLAHVVDLMTTRGEP